MHFLTYENKPRETLFQVNNNNNKNISDLKRANLKKDTVSSIYPRFFTYRSYLSITEKSNTYDVSFPQASISKNNSVSLNQRKGLLPGSKPKRQSVSGRVSKYTWNNKQHIEQNDPSKCIPVKWGAL